jgi:hypothetical protein
MGNLKGNYLRIGLLVILVAAVFAPTLVHAKDYVVGVKAGDWVKYGQITVTWTGNGTEPSYVTETKKVDWVRIDVLSVVGTIASLNQTVHFNNGTQIFQSFDTDVQSGNSAGTSNLIASNLTAGDPLSPQTPGTIINQTVTGLYAGANRNVNIIDYKGNLTVAGGTTRSNTRHTGTKAPASWLNYTRTGQTLPILAGTKKSRSKQLTRICGQQVRLTSYRTI